MEEFKKYFIISGQENTGKTTLFRLLVNKTPFSGGYRPTIGADYEVVKNCNRVLYLWDFAGQDRFKGDTSEIEKRASVFLICCDLQKSDSLEAVAQHINSAARINPHAQIIIVRTKSDLDFCDVSEKILENFALTHHCTYFSASAKNNTGIQVLKAYINNLLSKNRDVQSYPVQLSLFGVRPNKASGPRVCAVLNKMKSDPTFANVISDVAHQFLLWAKSTHRHFNSGAIKEIKELSQACKNIL